MTVDLKSSRILLTGGAGFLGSHVLETLRERGAEHVIVPRQRDCDLRDPLATRGLFEAARPAVVIHLAAKVGGIGANRRHPGSFFRDNMAMGLNVVEEARRAAVQKLLIAGTVCAYPKHTPVPFREEELWNGYPEETNSPYGIAKKALLVMAQAYREDKHTLETRPARLGEERTRPPLHQGLVSKCLIQWAYGIGSAFEFEGDAATRRWDPIAANLNRAASDPAWRSRPSVLDRIRGWRGKPAKRAGRTARKRPTGGLQSAK